MSRLSAEHRVSGSVVEDVAAGEGVLVERAGLLMLDPALG
jgi:hypothetical protein